MKPAAEFYWLARKPLMRGGVAANVLTHGTGALNIDACRVSGVKQVPASAPKDRINLSKGRESGRTADTTGFDPTVGRWPANLVLSHADGCERVGSRKVKAAPAWNDNRPPSLFTGDTTSPVHHADADGTETVDDWRCVDGCPCKALDEQSGESPSGGRAGVRKGLGYNGANGGNVEAAIEASEGGASRYFNTFAPAQFTYQPKAPTDEKERGLDHRKRRKVNDGRTTPIDNPYQRAETQRANTHPTAKSVALMRWLCRLVTPPGGLVLDPFTGSGSTGVACSQEGFRFIGFELCEEFAGIARDRIVGDSPLLNREVAR